jgi:lysophospholipase L1-like esterase
MKSEIFNAGVPGDNTRAILARLERDVIPLAPTLCVLLAGSNDTLNSAALLPAEETAANISAIAARLKEAGSQILLLTPPPFHEPYLLAKHPAAAYGAEGPGGRLAKIIASMKRFCGAMDIPLVDLHRIFSAVGDIGECPSSLIRNKANSNSEDGVHPTPDGYRLIAVCIYERILSLGLPCRRIVCLGDSMTYGLNATGMGTVEGEGYPARLNALLNGATAR